MPGRQPNSLHPRKELKYAGLDGRYVFAPIAFENLGVLTISFRTLAED